MDKIILEDGELELVILCMSIARKSAAHHAEMTPKPVFEGKVITPQTVRSFMPVFSGSMIAYVEAHYDDEEEKTGCAMSCRCPIRLKISCL